MTNSLYTAYTTTKCNSCLDGLRNHFLTRKLPSIALLNALIGRTPRTLSFSPASSTAFQKLVCIEHSLACICPPQIPIRAFQPKFEAPSCSNSRECKARITCHRSEVSWSIIFAVEIRRVDIRGVRNNVDDGEGDCFLLGALAQRRRNPSFTHVCQRKYRQVCNKSFAYR